jgi:AcrR family transcriptional regulator
VAAAIDPNVGLESVAAKLEAFLYPDTDPRQARKREAILRAATGLFIAYGYKKTTVDDVAGAAGVAKGTVYLYYQNKAELFLHAITLQKQQYLEEMAPVFDPTRSAEERLHELIVLSVELSHRMPLLAAFVNGEEEIAQVLDEVDDQTLDTTTTARLEFAAALIDEASGGGWPRDALMRRAELLMDLVFAAVHGGRLLRGGAPPVEYARELADVIIGGIASEQRSSD